MGADHSRQKGELCLLIDRCLLLRLKQISPGALKSALTGKINFVKWKDGQAKGVGAHSDVVSALLGRYGQWKFHRIVGVVSAQTLRRDGTVLQKEGLDPATGLFVMGPLPPMRPIPAKPTRDDALKAVALLDDLLDEFPFCDDASHAASLSGLITPAVRPALTCVPMHAGSATAPGTGKSYLGDMFAAPVLGDALPVIALGPNSEEIEKRLVSMIRSGVTLFSIDNVTTPLGGDALCQAIERPTFRSRILSKSEIKDWRNTWCMFATGHNLRLRDDVTRRTLLIRMDARLEQPETRTFKRNPLERILADRGCYIRAALIISSPIAQRECQTVCRASAIHFWSGPTTCAAHWFGLAKLIRSRQ